jgi:hypothetical protein
MRPQIRSIVRRLPLPLRSLLGRGYEWLEYVLFQIVRPYYVISRLLRRRDLRRVLKQPVTLFLSPDAGLTPYYAAHVILARSLAVAGEMPIILSCNGALPVCLYKSIYDIAATAPGDTANRACRACRKDALKVGDRYGIIDVTIDSLIGPDDRQTISHVIASAANAPWETFYDGISFGEAALGEVLRASKKLNVSEFDARDHAHLGAMIYASLAIYFSVKALAKRYSIKRIAFYGTYAYWIPPLMFARRHQIATTSFEHAYNLDIDRRALVLRSRTAHEELQAKIDAWPQYRDRPIDPEAVLKIADTSLFRLYNQGGKSMHSPVWIRSDDKFQSVLELSPDKKTIVAFSSSADEYLAGEYLMKACGKDYQQGQRPFADNVEWLRSLAEWAAERLDLQLVVRLHPRIAAAPGRPAASEYSRLKQQFANVPPNTLIIWPEDKVSSYNLAEIADLVTVAWSTLGLELARFGVPVISAFSGVGSYPTGTFVAFEATRQRYFEKLNAMLNSKASFSTIIEAFRWTHYLFMAPLVDLSDLIPTMDYGSVPRWALPKHQQTIMHVLTDNAELSTLNMAKLPRGPLVIDAELKAIVQAVHRFIAFFVTGEDTREVMLSDLRAHTDFSVSFELNGLAFRRYSPMAHRMTALLDQVVATV